MSWPTTLISLSKSDVLTRETTPPEYLEGVEWPPGVWVMIRVVEGELDLVCGDEAERLDKRIPGFVEPGKMARLEFVTEQVRYFVEIFREPSVSVEVKDS